jgi:ATP-binding cassette subfamily C (CFTR/MRP) protein 1
VVTPLLVSLSTFTFYVWSGHKLDVASALTALALFDLLRFPLFMLPQGS